MKTITFPTDMMALRIGDKVIEDIFTDESMRFEVEPTDYYGLSKGQVDEFLAHVYYNEKTGKLLSKELSDVFKEFGADSMEQTQRTIVSEYKKEWEGVRREHGLV